MNWFGRIGRVVLPFVGNLAMQMLGAEALFGGPKRGAEKAQVVIAGMKPQVEALATAGETSGPAEVVLAELTKIIDGFVALANVLKVFRKDGQ